MCGEQSAGLLLSHARKKLYPCSVRMCLKTVLKREHFLVMGAGEKHKKKSEARGGGKKRPWMKGGGGRGGVTAWVVVGGGSVVVGRWRWRVVVVAAWLAGEAGEGRERREAGQVGHAGRCGGRGVRVRVRVRGGAVLGGQLTGNDKRVWLAWCGQQVSRGT